jgi:hypothetical protein
MLKGGRVVITLSPYFYLKGFDFMAAEYSAIALQTVEVDDNIIFTNSFRACRKGFIEHRNDSGIFTLKGAYNGCRASYRVTFDGNIAIATGGTVEPISVALTINGEQLGNATAIVTPTVAGAFFNVSITSFIDVPCSCCVSVSVENTSATTDIDVQNANIVFERVA